MVDQHDADDHDGDDGAGEDIEVSDRAKEQAKITGADPEQLQYAMNIFDPEHPAGDVDDGAGYTEIWAHLSDHREEEQ